MQYVGDAVMAVFGAPVARRTTPRAVGQHWPCTDARAP